MEMLPTKYRSLSINSSKSFSLHFVVHVYRYSFLSIYVQAHSVELYAYAKIKWQMWKHIKKSSSSSAEDYYVFNIIYIFRKGSVLANFTVTFQKVSFTEALILQDAIDNVGYIADMPVELKTISTHDGKRFITTNFIF